MSIDEVLSYTEAAEYAKVSRGIVVSWVDNGLLTKHKTVGRNSISTKELDAMLEIRRKNPGNWKREWSATRNKGE